MKYIDLPNNFHSELRNLIHTQLPCHKCRKPLCSCSGAQKAEVVFLPGEREWIEQHIDIPLPGKSKESFFVSGNCTQLTEDYVCSAAYFRPWECYSFPMYPIGLDSVGGLIYTIADNCRLRTQLSNHWFTERRKGWELIQEQVHPEWFTEYFEVPIYVEEEENHEKTHSLFRSCT